MRGNCRTRYDQRQWAQAEIRGAVPARNPGLFEALPQALAARGDGMKIHSVSFTVIPECVKFFLINDICFCKRSEVQMFRVQRLRE